MNTANIYPDSLLNPDGFLDDPQPWTQELASAIARQDGLPEPGGDHRSFSHIRHADHSGKHCIERFFQNEREAWRIAGLPDPGEEARACM